MEKDNMFYFLVHTNLNGWKCYYDKDYKVLDVNEQIGGVSKTPLSEQWQ